MVVVRIDIRSISENNVDCQDVRMAKMPPCDLLALTAWDQRYSTQLPDSIRDFYLARWAGSSSTNTRDLYSTVMGSS